MHRLFVAIRPPSEVRAWLLARMGGVGGARWQSEDQLHLTLRFVGEVEQPAAEDVAIALASVRSAPFVVEPRGIGAFEHRGRPETLWAGLEPAKPLKALHSKIDQACIRAGLEPERRAYLPHITLARLGRDCGPIAGLLEQEGGARGPAFTVDGFGLFESRRGPDGATYSLVEHYPAR
ncbi:MAG: RNA 2',3'-cyclic phosphodiesterase [Allosphingosinicella sp.]